EEATLASIPGEPKKPAPEEMTLASQHPDTRSGSPEPLNQTMPSVSRNPMSPPPPVFSAEALVGKELSSYKILKKLAEGGMGVVLLGEHTLIGRRGAIKVLKAE